MKGLTTLVAFSAKKSAGQGLGRVWVVEQGVPSFCRCEDRWVVDDLWELSSLGDTCLSTSFRTVGDRNGRKWKLAGGIQWVGKVYEQEVVVEEAEG